MGPAEGLAEPGESRSRHICMVKWGRDPQPDLPRHQMPPPATAGTHGLLAKAIPQVLLLAALKHPELPAWDCHRKKRDGVWHCNGKLNTPGVFYSCSLLMSWDFCFFCG